MAGKITKVSIKDIRFPTSLEHHGSDAMHGEVDYSAVYVVISTDASNGILGHGLTFTLGRGNNIVLELGEQAGGRRCLDAIRANMFMKGDEIFSRLRLSCRSAVMKAAEVISNLVIGQQLADIFSNFGVFWRRITQEGQLRWLGPEKGVVHMAAAGIFNALWDMWAKIENKPVWKLLADMTPSQIVNLIDFSYINTDFEIIHRETTDVLTKEEAMSILTKNKATQPEREATLLKEGYPAYTTSTAWLGYSDETLKQKCQTALKEGWTKFKMKVGTNIQDDKRRAKLIRDCIGYDKQLMMDANQKWDVDEAILWMKELTEFKPLWIEEPTSPDDVLGHAAIAKALRPFGVGVATGEQCQNRVIFKQLLQADALSFLQIDSCRVGSVNENIAILLMAKKFNIPVCPHAGGVGLCELVQHIIMFDFLSVSGTKEGRMCEYVDHLHEHFEYPVVINKNSYMPPKEPGYSCTMKTKSLEDFEFPTGKIWVQLIAEGKFSA